MKTKIFIDFDDTLFNTKEVKKQMFACLEEHGFSMDQILDSYKADYAEGGFTIEGFLAKLGQIRSFDEIETKRKILSIYQKTGILSDTLPFLKNIDRGKYEVNLLTYGSPTHQKEKVKISGLEKYFDNLYYTPIFKTKYLKKLLSSDAHFIFIDDLSEVVADITQAFPRAKVIKINRTKDGKMEKGSIINITNLDQVMDHLR
jgi:FMN phosphatase YigB (HAD superfamily)